MTDVRPLSIAEIVDRSTTILVRSLAPIAVVGISYGAIPSIVLDRLSDGPHDEKLITDLAIGIAELFLSAPACAGFLVALTEAADGRRISVIDVFRRSARTSGSIAFLVLGYVFAFAAVVCAIAVACGIPAAILIRVTPISPRSPLLGAIGLVAIVLFVALSAIGLFGFFVAGATVVVRGARPFTAMAQTRMLALARGQRKRAAALCAIAFTPLCIFQIADGLADYGRVASSLTQKIVENVAIVFVTAFAAAIAVVFERDARIRLEGLDLAAFAERLEHPHANDISGKG